MSEKFQSVPGQPSGRGNGIARKTNVMTAQVVANTGCKLIHGTGNLSQSIQPSPKLQISGVALEFHTAPASFGISIETIAHKPGLVNQSAFCWR